MVSIVLYKDELEAINNIAEIVATKCDENEFSVEIDSEFINLHFSNFDNFSYIDFSIKIGSTTIWNSRSLKNLLGLKDIEKIYNEAKVLFPHGIEFIKYGENRKIVKSYRINNKTNGKLVEVNGEGKL